jgi:hypothetical protein
MLITHTTPCTARCACTAPKKKGWTEIMQEIIPSYLQRIVEQIVVELTHCG